MIDKLKIINAKFVALDAGKGTPTLATVRQLVEELIRALLAAEAEELSRKEILSALAETRAIHGKSPFIKRTQEWPRGYPGDFETIEYLVASKNHARSGSVEYFLEELALTSGISQQHRNKIQHQSQVIRRAIENNGDARIASIGCGGCLDLKAVADEFPEFVGTIVLNDMDKGALTAAEERLHLPFAEMVFLHGNIFGAAIKELKKHGPYDLILIGGVLDYLPERSVNFLLTHLNSVLTGQGGRLFFTNVNRANPYRVWMEYMAEWRLIERDPEEIQDACTRVGFAKRNISVTTDSTELALLVEIEKAPNLLGLQKHAISQTVEL